MVITKIGFSILTFIGAYDKVGASSHHRRRGGIRKGANRSHKDKSLTEKRPKLFPEVVAGEVQFDKSDHESSFAELYYSL